MVENTEPWQRSVPADLIPAIKHLRKSFDEAFWRCGHDTATLCNAFLYKKRLSPSGRYMNHLMQIEARVDPASARRYKDLMEAGTPPAIFEGFYGLYVAFASSEAIYVFKKLMEIGCVHEERLSVHYLEWAETQTRHLIRSHAHLISLWVCDVCGEQVSDPKENQEERISGKEWQAPLFLIMEPLRGKPYDASTAWERIDATVSSQLLKSFSDRFVLNLEMDLQRVSGEASLELAKQSKPIVTSAAENDTVAKEGAPHTASTARRNAGKQRTQAKYEAWQKAYQTFKKDHPDMSGVWYSRQIARMDIGKGNSAETIRKHMK